MPDTVTISTGSRLHFGLLSHGTASGRSFGGVGLMVNRLGVKLTACRSKHDVSNWDFDDELSSRIVTAVANYRERCPAEFQPPSCEFFEVGLGPSLHVGLGIGTQLALAVGRALAELAGEPTPPAVELARRVGRGLRSSLGIHGFQHGGLLVEGGKLSPDEISPLVARLEFPEKWQIVLITPRGLMGRSGSEERESFAQLAPMPQTTTDRLCRIALMELLPAVREEKLDDCGEALYEFGRTVGEYFAPVQGGTYAHPLLDRLAQYLRSQGIRGVGQTSWGPTMFALCPDWDAACQVAGPLSVHPEWDTCITTIVQAMNHGITPTV